MHYRVTLEYDNLEAAVDVMQSSVTLPRTHHQPGGLLRGLIEGLDEPSQVALSRITHEDITPSEAEAKALAFTEDTAEFNVAAFLAALEQGTGPDTGTGGPNALTVVKVES